MSSSGAEPRARTVPRNWKAIHRSCARRSGGSGTRERSAVHRSRLADRQHGRHVQRRTHAQRNPHARRVGRDNRAQRHRFDRRRISHRPPQIAHPCTLQLQRHHAILERHGSREVTRHADRRPDRGCLYRAGEVRGAAAEQESDRQAHDQRRDQPRDKARRARDTADRRHALTRGTFGHARHRLVTRLRRGARRCRIRSQSSPNSRSEKRKSTRSPKRLSR